MRPNFNLGRWLPWTLGALCFAAGGYLAGTARATGIPTTGTLTYSGLLEDQGQRVNSAAFPIGLSLWDDQVSTDAAMHRRCELPSAPTAVTNGRFRLVLPDDCVAAVAFLGDHLRFRHGSAAGWDGFGPVRTITRSRGNVLFELDGQPALALYKQYLGERAEDLPGSALLFPLIGISAGWIFTEMGRQPWIVYGLMKTSDGVSPLLTPLEVGISLAVFTLLYGGLAVIEVALLIRAVKIGPPETVELIDASEANSGKPLTFSY